MRDVIEKVVNCEMKTRLLEIKMSNNTGTSQLVSLFDNQFPIPSNVAFQNAFLYSFLNQAIREEPIRIFKISIFATTQDQIIENIELAFKDADGSEDCYFETTVKDIDKGQFQGNYIEFEPKRKMILDASWYIRNYKILAGQTVSFVFYYKQLKRICIKEYPNLFPPFKSKTPQIVEDLLKDVCKREDDFKVPEPFADSPVARVEGDE